MSIGSKLVHRADGDVPVACAKNDGKGRVFYSTFGHDAAYWDDPALSTMNVQAMTWASTLTEGDATPALKVPR